MAYEINNGAILQVLLRGNLFGQECMNTLHYRYSGPVAASGQALLETIALSPAFTAMEATWNACISQDVSNMNTALQWIYPLRYRAFTVPMIPAIGDAGVTGTANTAASIAFFADNATRHGVANKHIFGVPTNVMINGELSDAYVNTKLSIFAESYKTPLFIAAGQGLDPIIYNRQTPANSLAIVSYRVNTLVRTQRRRTVGVGK
jgi:hypothetical protein